MSTVDTSDEIAEPAGVSRRRFLTYMVATPLLTVGAQLLNSTRPPAADAAIPAPPAVEEIVDIAEAIVVASAPTMPLVKLEIGADGIARLDLPRTELGQGLTTSIGMMVAEELDLPLERVQVGVADARPELLLNQLTAGSCALRCFREPLQLMGASARMGVLMAAARRWNVSWSQLSVDSGVVHGPGGRQATFGELSGPASREPLDGVRVTPKPVSEYKLIGKPTKRVDGRDIVTGAKKFSMDIMPTTAKPTMLRRPPTMLGTPEAAHNLDQVRAMDGIHAVVQVPTGIAVVAETFEQAREGVNALEVSWHPGPIDRESNESIFREIKDNIPPFTTPPVEGVTVEAEFDWAPLNHAAMETESAVADYRADRLEIWTGSQAPILAQQSIAAEMALPQEKVQVHVVPPGGGFGRRVFYETPLEAAHVSKAAGMPVRLMWHRTHDMRHGRVRPPTVHKFRATILGDQVVAFEQRGCGVSTDLRQGLGEILTATATKLPPRAKETVGNGAFEQAVFLTMVSSPYNFGAYDKTLNTVANGMPTSSYRSVPCQPARTSEELMVDEVAAAMGKDPVEFRLSFLKDKRTTAVLRKAAELGDWGRAMPRGFAQGVAIHNEGRCHTACVVELDGRDPRDPRVVKVRMAVDVGLAVNPLGVRAQMEGGIAEAISLVLRAGLHIEDGLPLEGSYHNYHWLRQKDFPNDVEIEVVPNPDEPVGGTGEVGMTAPGAAIAKAYEKATGSKPRSFPLIFSTDFEVYPPEYVPPPPYKQH